MQSTVEVSQVCGEVKSETSLHRDRLVADVMQHSKMTRRVQVTLSSDLERRLILWAYTRDDRLPNWMKTVLRLRVDSNWEKIRASLDERAKNLGIPVEDLEKKILRQAGYDFEGEARELDLEATATD